MGVFVALDFETASQRKYSACAVGLVRVRDGEIDLRMKRLIRPPVTHFPFERLHGLGQTAVANARPFPEVWGELELALIDAAFVAAHNASFDRAVLRSCCLRFNLPIPPLRFVCTRQIARDELGIHPSGLANVCKHLGLPLEHHDPLSDAEACAQIVLASRHS